VGYVSLVFITKTTTGSAVCSARSPFGHGETVRLKKRQIYSAGSTASTPFFFTKTTTNFAGLVALALRPTVWTSLGPS
jgi:hypothetical protein